MKCKYSQVPMIIQATKKIFLLLAIEEKVACFTDAFKITLT